MRRLALGLALAACASRAPLPRPRAPLVATEDAPFRRQRPPIGEAPPHDAPAVEEATLPNGLRLIVARRDGAPLTEIALVSRRAGDESGDLPPGLAWLSTRLLVDVLANPATPGGPTFDVSSWVSHGSAGVYGNVHPAGLPAALLALQGALTGEVDEARFARVRAAAADGLLHRVGDDAVLDQIAFAAMYEDRVHARPSRGLSSELCALRLADAAAFLRGRYAPATSALVAVGRASMAEVRAAVDASLLGWASAPPPPRPAGAARLRRDGYRVLLLTQGGTEQAVIQVTAPLRAETPRARVALALFHMMLGATAGSRVYRALRVERGASYGVSSGLSTSLGATTLTVFGTVQQARTAESLRAVLAEVESLRTTAAPAWEFERGRTLLRQRLREQGAPDDDASMAWSLAMGFVAGEPAGEAAARSLEALASLTPEEVRRTVAASLDPSLIRVVVRGDPYEVGDDLATIGLGAVGFFHRDFGGDSACGGP